MLTEFAFPTLAHYAESGMLAPFSVISEAARTLGKEPFFKSFAINSISFETGATESLPKSVGIRVYPQSVLSYYLADRHPAFPLPKDSMNSGRHLAQQILHSSDILWGATYHYSFEEDEARLSHVDCHLSAIGCGDWNFVRRHHLSLLNGLADAGTITPQIQTRTRMADLMRTYHGSLESYSMRLPVASDIPPSLRCRFKAGLSPDALGVPTDGFTEDMLATLATTGSPQPRLCCQFDLKSEISVPQGTGLHWPYTGAAEDIEEPKRLQGLLEKKELLAHRKASRLRDWLGIGVFYEDVDILREAPYHVARTCSETLLGTAGKAITIGLQAFCFAPSGVAK